MVNEFHLQEDGHWIVKHLRTLKNQMLLTVSTENNTLSAFLHLPTWQLQKLHLRFL